uniref:SAM domain-containing protein n=1 Tax=Chromera velia CCMP2878 TaxID=1169474 RepID=A0A0G4I0E5_9ALVE|mmetsp:Transcript_44072/g.87008  ORF Transcript_44072/g.87008 Transcript_44072/m.87008 type:complete len:166 (+) Transcript_44072:187-684(+)|eukprot:Cvel_9935.t1-p1 / transcript=Cvel_9935.t1 / gene=Cvel_9935 / organism=Chromera_velia_CCMP2878 / gene_product=hypothetical protein / transcript_product=hypothetical protein / location=Cvel_scaffold587:48727-52042(+) / protein_length=165 / sequence_SO=supercontig / SO=protein_coding / is_pseudo=false
MQSTQTTTQPGGKKVTVRGQDASFQQLFARITQEIDDQQPANPVHFIVDFLCKHYPEHLHGFAEVWNIEPMLQAERDLLVQFLRHHKISSDIAQNFIDTGYDTLESLMTLNNDDLQTVKNMSGASWAPGHVVRLQQLIADMPSRIQTFRQDREALQSAANTRNFR